jgi:hypothetical protein
MKLGTQSAWLHEMLEPHVFTPVFGRVHNLKAFLLVAGLCWGSTWMQLCGRSRLSGAITHLRAD